MDQEAETTLAETDIGQGEGSAGTMVGLHKGEFGEEHYGFDDHLQGTNEQQGIVIHNQNFLTDILKECFPIQSKEFIQFSRPYW